MDVQPGTADRSLAAAIHTDFMARPGSEHISSPFALAGLSSLITRHRPRRVLELGAGIGTATRLMLEHADGPEEIVSTEDNSFCLEALATNVPADPRLTVVTSLGDLLRRKEEWDLMICDGGFGDPKQYRGITTRSRFFFEGGRSPERRALRHYITSLGLRYAERQYLPGGWCMTWRRTWPRIKRIKGFWVARLVAVQGA